MPLFERYPRLHQALPHVVLTELPTPVQRFLPLEKRAGAGVLLVKRDDLTAMPYGGNKVRKLEFLLARAKADGCVRVMTVGGAGSNHALATALYARQCGLKSAMILFPQPNARAVRENLLMDLYTGTDVHACDNYADFPAVAERLTKHYLEHDGVAPMLIPAGGSAPLGVVGYVNAGMELAAQIQTGTIDEPGELYVALGTMGTAAGLAIGLRAAGSSVPVVGVRVVPTVVASEEKLSRLIQATVELLRNAEPDFPEITAKEAGIRIEHDFFGGEYGRFTPQARRTMSQVHESTGLRLDGVYTGKAFAAMMANAHKTAGDRPILFWNTKNSRPLPEEALILDYHDLPEPLHCYFEEPVQPEPD